MASSAFIHCQKPKCVGDLETLLVYYDGGGRETGMCIVSDSSQVVIWQKICFIFD